MIEVNIKIPKRKDVPEVVRRFRRYYSLLYIVEKDTKYEMRSDYGDNLLAYIDVKETKENDYAI